MNKAIKWFLTFAVALSGLSAMAQNERTFFTVKMRNGDVITGMTEISSISFKTAYGDLAMPIRDVSAITLGINTTGVDKNQVRDLLDKVQNGALNEASSAFDRLLKMEVGIVPVVKEYLSSATYKKRENSDFSVDLLYDVLLSRYNLPKNFHTKDLLQTTGASVIEGHYDFESIGLETDYGSISVNRAKIVSITVSFKDVNNPGSGTYKLNANQNIVGNSNGGWLNTGILIRKDQSVQILASGVVNIASLSNNAYTPDGGVNGTPGPKSNEPSYGCLVFKIGESGQVVKAGDTFVGKAMNTGILYLSIFESVYNAANTGTYTVKVTANQQ
ncbi:MAG: hypothetical protein JST90_13535 [Bacteroidetes bacterium]|nr:hypothetical protein [Bacteroidota bacterium]